MTQRPYRVTGLGWFLIVVCIAMSGYHLKQLTPRHALEDGNAWIFVLELTGIVAGAFLLRGKNWARWLVLAWIAFHVVVGFLDSPGRGIFHALILMMFAYALFRPEANAYFRGENGE